MRTQLIVGAALGVMLGTASVPVSAQEAGGETTGEDAPTSAPTSQPSSLPSGSAAAAAALAGNAADWNGEATAELLLGTWKFDESRSHIMGSDAHDVEGADLQIVFNADGGMQLRVQMPGSAPDHMNAHYRVVEANGSTVVLVASIEGDEETLHAEFSGPDSVILSEEGDDPIPFLRAPLAE